jgi:thiol:disulfide interchange protein DsbG
MTAPLAQRPGCGRVFCVPGFTRFTWRQPQINLKWTDPCQNTMIPPHATDRRRLLRRALRAAMAAAATLLWPGAADAADSAAEWSADPDAARAAALLARIGQARWLQEGSGPRIVYVFFDPNCPYSHKLYLATRAEVGRHGLQLRWIPVGQLHASSPGKAAAILSATDPLAAFHKNEDDWDFGESPGGGIRPLAHPSEPVKQELRRNAALLHHAGLQTFPVMLYRTADGKAHLVVGLLPEDTLLSVLRRAR